MNINKLKKIIGAVVVFSALTLNSLNFIPVQASRANSETGGATSSGTTSSGGSSSSSASGTTSSSSSSGKTCGGTQTSIIGCDPEGDENPIIALLKEAIKILYLVIGILAVVMVMVAGAIYAMAGDSEERVKTAKTMIKNTVIGILLYVFMTVILNFLVPGGVF